VIAESRGGYSLWATSRGGVEIRFAGRGPRAERRETLAALGESLPVAWATQVHGASLLRARAGECGEGDALLTAEPGLALSIATADCVPVLLASPQGVAAVHAGWRGMAQGVLAPAVAALGAPAEVRAWIGPAIGQCCYEVGNEVAQQVVDACSIAVTRPGPRGRPHLDLAAAARLQLEAAGVGQVELLISCTRCDERLWSYRRDGKSAGRNLAFIWRR
jgi:hypothetical protein